jgi:hypothetical protein
VLGGGVFKKFTPAPVGQKNYFWHSASTYCTEPVLVQQEVVLGKKSAQLV